MQIYRAVVVDNKDPQFLARVKLRIYGIQDENEESNAVENLPWSEVMGGTEFGLTGGVGISCVLQQGTMVYCILEDDDPNKPIVIGTCKGIPTGAGGAFGDPSGEYPPKERVNFADEDAEPVSRFGRSDLHPLIDGDYVNSTIIETTVGHVIQLSGDKIMISHNSGTRMEFLADGKIAVTTVSDVDIDVTGTVNCTMTEDMNISAEGDINFTAEGNINITATGDFNSESSGATNITASSDVIVQSSSWFTASAPRIDLN